MIKLEDLGYTLLKDGEFRNEPLNGRIMYHHKIEDEIISISQSEAVKFGGMETLPLTLDEVSAIHYIINPQLVSPVKEVLGAFKRIGKIWICEEIGTEVFRTKDYRIVNKYLKSVGGNNE